MIDFNYKHYTIDKNRKSGADTFYNIVVCIIILLIGLVIGRAYESTRLQNLSYECTVYNIESITDKTIPEYNNAYCIDW